jgi:SulP family sulfate permease
MTNLETLKREWFSNPRCDILAGIVVALALIPEAIGFSIIAGVDSRVGLYASFSIAVIISLVGVIQVVAGFRRPTVLMWHLRY